MVHSTQSPAASQSATAHSDWYIFLRSAFITGFKAYGASMMVIAPPETIEAQNSVASPTPSIRNHSVAKSQPQTAIKTPALPQMPLARPAWRNA